MSKADLFPDDDEPAAHDDPGDPGDDQRYDDQGYDDQGDGYDDDAQDDTDFGEYEDDGEERPDRKPVIALGVLAVLVVVGLFLALQAIGGIGGGDDDVVTEPSTDPPASSSAPASAPASEPAAPAGPVPQVSGVRTLDPQGGDGENDETAPRAIDDDPSSFWRSSTYSSAQFGGLKDGLGMVVTLSEESAVSSVTLQVGGSGGAMELRSAPGQGLEGSEVIGTADPGSGTVTIELAEPVTTQNLLLWWTELPDADGSFRIELADVTVQ